MGYKPPLYETDFLVVSEHNKSQIAPGHAFALNAKGHEKTATLDFFRSARVAQIRCLFLDISNHNEGDPALILFHAVSGIDGDVNHMNSKLPWLHMHMINGDLGEGFEHIETHKTYVPHPRPNVAADIEECLDPDAVEMQQRIVLSGTEAAEAAHHEVLYQAGYCDMEYFFGDASDDEIDAWRRELVAMVEPLVQEGAGGARLIIDERYNRSNSFAIHVVGGEPMGQGPEGQGRWFEAPPAPEGP